MIALSLLVLAPYHNLISPFSNNTDFADIQPSPCLFTLIILI